MKGAALAITTVPGAGSAVVPGRPLPPMNGARLERDGASQIDAIGNGAEARR
jgi:hypothetical protein